MTDEQFEKGKIICHEIENLQHDKSICKDVITYIAINSTVNVGFETGINYHRLPIDSKTMSDIIQSTITRMDQKISNLQEDFRNL